MLARTLFSLLPLLASFALAAPTKRQDGVTVVNNCYNSGQVALTFDGECMLYVLWKLELIG